MIVSGDQLRAARAKLGWSQTDLGRAAAIHRNAVGYWERHKSIGCQNSNGAVARMREAFEGAGIRFSELPRPRRPLVGAAQSCTTHPMSRHYEALKASQATSRVISESMPSRSKSQKPSSQTEARVPKLVRPKRECGARTRLGQPCKRSAYTNGRCRNHGGLSTGPKTWEGRRRCAEAVKNAWTVRRAAHRCSHQCNNP